jgi:hypothetical protein
MGVTLFLRQDVYHRNLGLGGKKLCGAGEECLSDLSVDVGPSSAVVLEGVEDVGGRNL